MSGRQQEMLQHVVQLSEQMLAHATENRWDEVTRLEAVRGPLVERAFSVPDNKDEVQAARLAIQTILQINERISKQLASYQTSVTGQLQSIDTGRQATKAYQEILQSR